MRETALLGNISFMEKTTEINKFKLLKIVYTPSGYFSTELYHTIFLFSLQYCNFYIFEIFSIYFIIIFVIFNIVFSCILSHLSKNRARKKPVHDLDTGFKLFIFIHFGGSDEAKKAFGKWNQTQGQKTQERGELSPPPLLGFT